MFRKLKEKITEEVKSSPQRLQQFTQSVSDKLQNSTQSDDNLFSIGEDDANNSEAGFSNISLTSPPNQEAMSQRRNSNSSIASDVSFLPRYESMANMYHLQSDLDISASELEDNASTTSQLGHLSKEQIYSAFQKAQMRYHKYRGRYTDLAKHYKDLERENGKMKLVLVETQDKAIRRVTDLKEQCALEQKAKAHLEGALRDELDEKQFKIQTLQTKIGLLQQDGGGGGGGGGESLSTNQDLLTGDCGSGDENLAVLTKDLNEARNEIENLNEKLQETKANTIILQTKEQEYKMKIVNLEKEINLLNEREKENNLKIAENKMDLHNEILSKDSEINQLKIENEQLKLTVDQGELSRSNENLQIQNKKLIEKLENLTIKCNNYESDLIKLEQYQIELKNLMEIKKVCEHNLKEKDNEINLKNNELQRIRDEAKKSLMNLERKIREEIMKEFQENEEKLKIEYEKKFQEITSNLNNLQQIQLQLMEKDELIKKLQSKIQGNEIALKKIEEKYQNLEQNHLELIEESAEAQNTIKQHENNLTKLNEEITELNLMKLKIENELSILREELISSNVLFRKEQESTEQLQEEKLQLESLVKDLEGKVRLGEEKDEAIDLDNTETKLLEMKLQKLEIEHKNLLDDFEQERKILETKINDNSKLLNLEETIKTLTNELTKTKELLRNQEIESKEIEEEKLKLEQLVDELQRKVRLSEEKDEAIDLDNTETKLLEMKLQKIEEEKSYLIKEFENERIIFEKLLSESNELKTCEENTTHLQLKLNEVEDLLRKHIEHSIKLQNENNFVQQLNFDMEQTIKQLQEKVRLWEEKDEAIDLDNTETRLLQMKLQKMEEDKRNLLEEFEMERVIFEDLLKDNTKLQECQDEITRLEETLAVTNEVIETVNKKLRDEEERYSQLHEENLRLELTYQDKIQLFETSNEMERKIFDEMKENKLILEENCNLLRHEIDELQNDKLRLENDKMKLQETVKGLQVIVDNNRLELRELKTNCTNLDELAEKNVKFELQLNDLIKEKQLLIDEINELKLNSIPNIIQTTANNKLLEDNVELINYNKSEDCEKLLKEIESLKEKLTQYKLLDLTNRSSIEFYENELQKLKNKNEKLNQKLDETIVTLNHCTDLSKSTEIEYLRNVLYNYMIGKESLVLARVIAAVCKFDKQQTDIILQKEQQKQTLLGQLGIL